MQRGLRQVLIVSHPESGTEQLLSTRPTRSKTGQKRDLIAFVFSNLRLRGRKLEFTIRSPFDLMIGKADFAG